MRRLGRPLLEALRRARLRTAWLLLASLASASLVVSAGCASVSEEERLLNEIRESTIVPKLGSYDEKEQRIATTKVREALDRAPEGTAEILAQSLRDPILEDRTKLMIAYFLAEIGDERGIPILFEHLGVENDAVKDLVQRSIARYGIKTVPQLIDVMQSGNDVARQNATEILVGFQSREVYDTMWERYRNEPHGQIRFLLLCGFAEDSRPLAEERLIVALDDNDELVREHAWAIFRTRTDPPEALGFTPLLEGDPRAAAIRRIRDWYRRDMGN